MKCPESVAGKWLIIAGLTIDMDFVAGVLFFTRQLWTTAYGECQRVCLGCL